MRIVKLVVFVVGLLAIGLLAVGLLSKPAFESRTTHVVGASPARVFAVVGDPRRTGEWLPKEVADIVEVRTHATGVAGKLFDALVGHDQSRRATHTYRMRDGTTLDMQVTAWVPGREFKERVVGGNALGSGVSDAEWGFELAPVDGQPDQTQLVVTQKGLATNVLSRAMTFVMRQLGVWERSAAGMAAGIEVAAKGSKGSEGGASEEASSPGGAPASAAPAAK